MTTDAGGAVPLRVQGVIELASWENEGGPPLPPTPADERLDWAGFLARFYPDARKHGYAPLAAYVEYREHWRQQAPTTRTEPRLERRWP
jgi:hypothetical protein